jgi:predicted nucleic acid-binding protein
MQAAIVGGRERVLSEDMQHGAVLGEVRIENLFVTDFTL